MRPCRFELGKQPLLFCASRISFSDERCSLACGVRLQLLELITNERDFGTGGFDLGSRGFKVCQHLRALCIEFRPACGKFCGNGRRRSFALAQRRRGALQSSFEVFDQDEKLTLLLEPVRDLRLQPIPVGSGSFYLRDGGRE